MDEIVTYSITGDCPHTASRRTIEIDYFVIYMAGKLAPGYKKRNCLCPHYSECASLDSYNRCPLYLSAPDVPR